MTERMISPGWATYLRVSDEDKQTPERSFAMQRQRIQEQLLVSSDLSLKREYTDTLTGTSPNRKDYQQMLADAESGLFSHLGLYRADRFGRDTVEGLQAATRLIGWGIKIRVAHMPSLMPETPDGFFMFLIQMGMAQREVDVLKQRTADGMEAKLRDGGWPQRAPDGYVNKEKQVSSNKYERWVEIDPIFSPVLKLAWELLLTAQYSLTQICEELARRGHTRASGRPWAWDDPKTGKRFYADNRLHKIFHNPFYAGWAVSKKFGIQMGEVRGQWDPIITPETFERCLDILHQHDAEKSREKKHFYLLRNLLWVEIDGKLHRMFVSTPTGHSRSYPYYHTHTKPRGKKIYVQCGVVDGQIPNLLSGVVVDAKRIPLIRDTYTKEVKKASRDDRENKLTEYKRQLVQLRDEEARLGRLLISNKISEDTYDQLRKEWQEKQRAIQVKIIDLERETSMCLDDLDAALVLMTKLSFLYKRLAEKERSILLQVLFKRIIVDEQGQIIDHELNSPFSYLRNIADSFRTLDTNRRGSEGIPLGAPR